MHCCCCLHSWILTKPPSIPITSDENHHHTTNHPPIPTRLPRSRFRFAVASFSLETKKLIVLIIYFVGWIANHGSPSQLSDARLHACLLLYFLLILLYYYYSVISNVLRLLIVDTERHPTPPYYEEKKASWHTLTILITITRIHGLC